MLSVANPTIGSEKAVESAEEGVGCCGAGVLEIGSIVW